MVYLEVFVFFFGLGGRGGIHCGLVSLLISREMTL